MHIFSLSMSPVYVHERNGTNIIFFSTLPYQNELIKCMSHHGKLKSTFISLHTYAAVFGFTHDTKYQFVTIPGFLTFMTHRIKDGYNFATL